MTRPVHWGITDWIVRHLLWDESGPAQKSLSGRLLAKWRLWAAVVGSAVLTWAEWVKNRPPEIAVVALIHFVFVLVVIAILVHIGRWVSHIRSRST